MGSNEQANGSRMRLVDKNQKESSISPSEYLDLFEKSMKKLAMAVDKDMGEGRYLIYFEQLHGYSIEEIQAAVDQAIHDEEYNVIPAVGKIIHYIERAKRERAERYNPFQIEFKREEILPERLRELIKPFYDKLAAIDKKRKRGEG